MTYQHNIITYDKKILQQINILIIILGKNTHIHNPPPPLRFVKSVLYYSLEAPEG